jgi:glutaconate CoA-transferase subunit B
VTLLHDRRRNSFTDGSRELFDLAAQGRIDVFFLGGVQIDGQANVNLVGTGTYPKLTKRLPGSFGSAYLYFVVPQVILYREEHSPRTLVERVDFVSAPGVSQPGVFRPGGPSHLLTGKALFTFDAVRARFRLEQHAPEENVGTLRAATGFTFDAAERLGPWPAPSPETLDLIQKEAAPALAESYPEFAGRVFEAPA